MRGEIRSTPRIDCIVPAIIQDKGVSIACTVEDLSITGCRVRLNSFTKLSQNFLFEFPERTSRFPPNSSGSTATRPGSAFSTRTALRATRPGSK
ncbi:MAG: PilZ domain-containing protein [Alphaproteobacteria bacterium]|nr:PilZ domain-containing protein [Alphaproteobacteria bacterium]